MSATGELSVMALTVTPLRRSPPLMPTNPREAQTLLHGIAEDIGSLKSTAESTKEAVERLQEDLVAFKEQVAQDRKADAPALATAKALRWVILIVGTATLTGLVGAALA